jgi:penicillin amidase
MRWARRFVALLVLLLITAVAALAWFRQASLPQIHGKLKLSGLSAPVDVVRDHEGVPHIYAGTEGDAYFALGFVHAQDRLWQMEMNRRIHSARLAEILGPDALDTDRFLRTIGVRRNAEREFAHYDAPTRAALQRYADGVNAYLTTRKGPLPIEFLLTGAPEPEPWTPVDSVGWATMMAWDLAANWRDEILRMRLAQRLSKQQIDELLPPYAGNPGAPEAPLATADYTALYRRLHDVADAAAAVSRAAPAGFEAGMGSNNWVVSGARSETGKPLLANDPHLGLSAPALWYFAHLSAPGLNVIGATLPGLPFVVLGRTDRIAWGFTNTGPDVEDLYVEQIRGDQVRTPGGWEPLQTRTEVIHVKGAQDVLLTVRETRHGPIISDVTHSGKAALEVVGSEHYALAFKWTALLPDDTTVQAGVKLNHARDWPSFLAAARDFDSPEQNIVYADVDGNIGYVAPGRVPIRRPDNDLKGQAPAPGWDARYDWAGFIAFEDLPHQFNPASGRIATANQKVVPDDYPFFITADWEPSYRWRRIDALLDARAKHSLDSFAAIQADQRSVAADDILPLLLTTPVSGEPAQTALAMLKDWDGTMGVDRAEPVIYEAWMRELARQIYSDELGPELFADAFGQRQVFIFNVLSDKGGQSRWCDDVTTPRVETCDEIKARALDLALADLRDRLGPDMKRWKWGDLHIAHSEHRPFSSVPQLSPLFDLRARTGGDRYTIDVGVNTIANPKEPYASSEAPSLRALYDLSDLERSRFIHSTGQSGDRLSRLYDNFQARWVAVEYIPMQMKRASVEAGAQGTLSLVP